MNEFTLQRIAAMEAAFDRTALAVQMLESALDTYETIKVDIDRLTEYLESGAWREDYEADEAGLVPPDLKRAFCRKTVSTTCSQTSSVSTSTCAN